MFAFFCLAAFFFGLVVGQQQLSSVQCTDKSGKVVATATESILDSRLYTVHWDKTDYQTAFVTTLRSNLYRTTDGGKSWHSQLDKMPSANEIQEPAGYAGIDQVIETTDPKKFFFLSYGARLWTTSDAGGQYQDRAAPGDRLDSLVPHPVDADTALAQVTTNACHTSYSPAARVTGSADPGPCLRSLWLTRDLGQSWHQVSEDLCPYSFAWGSVADPTTRRWPIWFRRYDQAGVNQFEQSRWASALWQVTDLDAVASGSPAPQLLLQHALAFLTEPSLKFDLAVRFESPNSTALQFLFSDDRGSSWHVARFPSAVGDPDSYIILDQTEGVVFTLVRMAGDYSFGTLFASDSLGADWSLSLPFTRIVDGAVEFHRLAGIDGIFAANVKRDPLHDTDRRANTRVTFDNGATWQPFAATRVRDATTGRSAVGAGPPEPLTCPGSQVPGLPPSLRECSLNLYLAYKSSRSSQYTPYGPIHSVAQAPGLILATGNVGPSLAEDGGSFDTFLSRNAGGDWIKVRNGSHIYEVGDSGGLLVMADDQRPTDTLVWSGDMGTTWTECKFTGDGPFDVNNIHIESTGTGSVFLIQGTRALSLEQTPPAGVNPAFPGSRREGVLVHFELNPFEHQCTSSDLITWSPSDASATPCFQGAKTVYRRRDTTAQCFLGPRPNPSVGHLSTTPCSCTPADYRCSFCYERVNGVCSRIHDASQGCPDHLPPPDPCVGSYTDSAGYERIPGNLCVPPLDKYEGVSRPCPGSNNPILPSDTAGAVVGVLLGLVGVGVAVCAVLYRTNDNFNARVAQLRIPGLRGKFAPSRDGGPVAGGAFDDGLLADSGDYSSDEGGDGSQNDEEDVSL